MSNAAARDAPASVRPEEGETGEACSRAAPSCAEDAVAAYGAERCPARFDSFAFLRVTPDFSVAPGYRARPVSTHAFNPAGAWSICDPYPAADSSPPLWPSAPFDRGHQRLVQGGTDPSSRALESQGRRRTGDVGCVSWFKRLRLLAPIGYIPPTEAEANYCRQLAGRAIPARLEPTGLHETQGGSGWSGVSICSPCGRPSKEFQSTGRACHRTRCMCKSIQGGSHGNSR